MPNIARSVFFSILETPVEKFGMVCAFMLFRKTPFFYGKKTLKFDLRAIFLLT